MQGNKETEGRWEKDHQDNDIKPPKKRGEAGWEKGPEENALKDKEPKKTESRWEQEKDER